MGRRGAFLVFVFIALMHGLLLWRVWAQKLSFSTPVEISFVAVAPPDRPNITAPEPQLAWVDIAPDEAPPTFEAQTVETPKRQETVETGIPTPIENENQQPIIAGTQNTQGREHEAPPSDSPSDFNVGGLVFMGAQLGQSRTQSAAPSTRISCTLEPIIQNLLMQNHDLLKLLALWHDEKKQERPMLIVWSGGRWRQQGTELEMQIAQEVRKAIISTLQEKSRCQYKKVRGIAVMPVRTSAGVVGIGFGTIAPW
jgi:hypothetical protein